MKRFVEVTLLVSLVLSVSVGAPHYVQDSPNAAGDVPGSRDNTSAHHGVHLASWNYDYVKIPLLLCIFLIVVGVLKLVFHWAEWLSSVIPESCLLIVFGVAIGAIFHFGFGISAFRLHPRTFMLFLLPPIVIDSAFSLNDRCFAENVGSILVYAVIGTLFNFICIGSSLFGLMEAGAMGSFRLGFVECLLFSSFIVAVDPVAVLAIFQEVGVNNVLYFLVFGESLLNDAVTVVIYNMMKAFNSMEEIPGTQIAIGIGSFFSVSLGGALIGLLFGILTSLFTKLTSHVRVVEPLAILSFGYMAYLGAELVHWSGIISLIVCGLVQSQYALHNISRKSNTTVKYFVKMTSSTSDAIIFLFLGFEVVSQPHEWNTGFVLWSILLCLVFRLISVFGLTAILNKIDQSRVKKIGMKEQFIMWYGGLRGAVCFALVATLSESFQHKSLFITTTLVVICFTVFVQGITIKPLVNVCKIRRQEEKSHLMAIEVNDHVTDHLMSGMEVVVGYIWGEKSLREALVRLNDNYLRRWLQKDPLTQDQQIVDFYRRVAIKDHVAYIEGAIKQPLLLCQEDQQVLTEEDFNEPEDIVTDTTPQEQRRERLGTVSGRILRKKRGRSHGDNLIEDLRSAMLHSSFHSLHQTYDPNLTREGDTDMLHHLREKHTRTRLARQQQVRQSHYIRAISEFSDGDKPVPANRRAFSEGHTPDAETADLTSPGLPSEPVGKASSTKRPTLLHQEQVGVEMAPFLNGTSIEGTTEKEDFSEV